MSSDLGETNFQKWLNVASKTEDNNNGLFAKTVKTRTETTNHVVNFMVLLLKNRLRSSAICSWVFRFATITIM